LITITAATPVVPVALNVTGEPLSDPEVALSEFAPELGPSVHEPTVAMPKEFVVAFSPAIEPPPETTANVTDAPDTAFPLASEILTEGAWATAVPTAAVCPLDAGFAIAMVAGGPERPVAVIVTRPDTPGVEAVIEFGPAVIPSVHEPTVAIPEELLVALAPVIDPPPLATRKLTIAPFTGLLLPSTTFTDGGVAIAEPAIAVCASPELTEIDPAEPATPVAVKVTVLSVPETEIVATRAFGPAMAPSFQLPTVAVPFASVV
jgi:hypothetical protein